MKHFIVLLIVCLLGKPNSHAQSFKLNAKITDVDTMMVIVGGFEWSDTLFIIDGHVNFERKLDHHQMIRIIFVKNQQSIAAIKEGNERKVRSKSDGVFREIFSDDQPITFTATFSNVSNIALETSAGSNHSQYIAFRKRFDPLVKIARTVIDSSNGKGQSDIGAVYTMLYNRILAIEEEVAAQFVKDYANTITGAYVLYRYCRIEDADKLNALYQLFGTSFKQSGYLRNIEDKLRSLKALVAGKRAPDFVARTKQGNVVTLDALKGKYVVLDFWGSWCQPCIIGFPKMKLYQSKFKDKCVFLGISCNDEYKNWIEALNKYGLDWLQILNPDGEADIARKYNVEAFPTKIILDQNGIFIASFVGESENFYQYLDTLFSKN